MGRPAACSLGGDGYDDYYVQIALINLSAAFSAKGEGESFSVWIGWRRRSVLQALGRKEVWADLPNNLSGLF